ncbi:MAG: ATP-binding cassette domain-containing protein [Bacteroidetes bacterium]|nr:ATP-binding cassette domain-containing protein [Bacteroidota bacterium]
MRVEAKELGKRYRRTWVFRNLALNLESGQRWALTGVNGSGKSTLLRMLAAALRPTSGTLRWLEQEKQIPVDQVYTRVSLAAPYLELIDPFTLREHLAFHGQLKPWLPGWDAGRIMADTGLERHADKALRDFSSGMRQRVRLALAFYSQSELLLLDEPTSNLDAAGKAWFKETLERCAGSRLVVIASNVEEETLTCTHSLHLDRDLA